MAKNDVKIVKGGGGVLTFNAEDRTTSSQSATMKAGEPVKRGGTGGNFAYLLATGDPEIGTDIVLGIVSKESTETSTVDGTVEVATIVPGTMLRAKATTAGNIDTAAKILALTLDYVTFDYSSSTYTIDEDEGDDPNSQGLQIIAGDSAKGTLDVIVHINATMYGSLVGQTIN